MLRLALTIVFLTTTAHAQLREWKNYRTILWMSGAEEKHTSQWPLVVQRIKELGINTGMGHRDAPPQRFMDSGMGYYVENIVNKGLCLKFSSPVTNWSNHVDEWAKARNIEAFIRPYTLSDPQWLLQAQDLMKQAANAHKASSPLMYDIRDELSTTLSANPFDYDFSPMALADFRIWLRTYYSELSTLNAQWDTDFPSWESVRPFTTDQIKARMLHGERQPTAQPDWQDLKQVRFDPAAAAKNPIRWNLSPWCDHRSYMDYSLARCLSSLRQAARQEDPTTPVGIEGTQMPSAFGGYDLWQLSQALDWVEPYDVCNSRDIFASSMEGKPILATVFEKDSRPARRRLWHLLLLGDKGCIVWWSEDVIDWTKPHLPLTPKGQALAPVLHEMQSPLAQLFLNAQRQWDPIHIHYSQPSIQVAWLMESLPDGRTWHRRFSSYEATHNQHAQVRNGWLKLLHDMGYSPRFSPDADAPQAQLTVYPRPWCQPAPVGPRSIIDGAVAFFDTHGRYTRSTTVCAPDSISVGDKDVPGSMVSYPVQRVHSQHVPAALATIQHHLEQTVGPPPVRVPLAARVRTHRLAIRSAAKLLAFERNIDYKMSEDLAQAGGNEALEQPITFTAQLPSKVHVYELRTNSYVGHTDSISVQLDPWQPSLYALTDQPIEGPAVETLLKQAE
jgi:hypothetical protein